MADYTQLMNLEKKKKEQPAPHPTPQPTSYPSTEQSINPSTNRSIDQSTHQGAGAPMNKVMEKPRGFYITERLNQRIDETVRYYQEKHHLRKVDRSIVVTALLDNEANWTEETLDLLLDKVISELTRRLTNR